IASGHAVGVDATRYAQIILEQGERMATIIRNLLQFGRRAGGLRETTDLRLLADRAALLLAPVARKREATLDVRQAGHPVWATVNPAEVEQVLTNLLMNALQASTAGASVGMEVRSEDDPDKQEKKAVVCVSDTGVGIPPQNLQHIFDPFFTTKDVG